MDLGLNGRTVLVTGGSSGIGRAIATLYAREPGVGVAITYHSREAEAAALVEELEKMGARVMAVHMALGDHDTIQSAVDAVARTLGGVDVLINNAVQWGDPANRGRRFEDVPISYWEEMLRANLIGTVRVTQLAVPFMRARKWGRIVNISSDVAYDSMIGSGPYGSTKAALEGLTSNLVTELSADGILSNVVVPSWTLTDRALRSFPEEFRAIAAGAFPTGRITEPEDVASLAVYLGSAANGHVNGEVIRATGKGSQATLSMAMREFRERR
jgi:3-oxoacyl-[acyl-carrier protein] reductase